MYLSNGAAVPSPDPAAGLYICNRAGSVVQATIPPGHIAYQMGQVMVRRVWSERGMRLAHATLAAMLTLPQ
jgi:hypothetical protein